VDGLISQEKAIQKQMDKIAAQMVAAIKKALGIKSPSKVMAEIGMWSGQGVIEGLDSMATQVQKSSEGIGAAAILGLSKSIKGMQDLVGSEIDLTPVIAPVLDLTDVQAGVARMGTLLTQQPVSVSGAYSAAKDASIGYQSNQTALAELQAILSNPTPTIEYNQYNNSPKALSSAEIYRQTNNQLSTVKEALPK